MSDETESKGYRKGTISGHPVLGCLKDIREDTLGFYDRCSCEGDIVKFRLAHRRVYAVHHPDLVKEVLLTNYENFVKRGIYGRMKPVFRNGLVTSMGSLWKKQRRTMQPMFSRRNMEAMVSTLDGEVRNFREELLKKSDEGVSIDLFKEMLHIALRLVTATMFSEDVSDRHEEIAKHIHYLNIYVTKSLYSLTPPILWLPTKANRRFRHSMKVLDSIVLELVEKRREAGDLGDDLLGMLLTSKDPDTGEVMSTEQVRDEAISIFIAGHETTATALTWTYDFVNKNPDVLVRMQREVDEVLPKGDGALTYETIKKLDYLERVFMESMRLRPPIYMIYRWVENDCQLGGYNLKRGDTVYVSPYVSNRDQQHWQDPELFAPDRFLADEGGHKNKFVFYPFGAGPRSCIGSHFALLEARMVLSILGESLVLKSKTNDDVIPDPLVTMQPRDPVIVDIIRREETLA